MKLLITFFLLACPLLIPASSPDLITLPTPGDATWSVATKWSSDWMDGWVHASPTKKESIGDRTILSGEMMINEGVMKLRDSYRKEGNLIHCTRRYEWTGKDTLPNATLSVRLRVEGDVLRPFLPGILYYGNRAGAKVNDKIIPVYNARPGEFALFEEHRYPMPFALLEDAANGKATAVHSVPSPVRGAILPDLWWSMGVEAYDGYSEIVLYSGPIGYNGKHSVAKALQSVPMGYTDTYINMEPGRVVEKEFYVEQYDVKAEGSGFQQAVYSSLELNKPYDVDRFPKFDDIVKGKYEFAKTRWIDNGNAAGFGMYDLASSPHIVMGWCGQAGSLGYALQALTKRLSDKQMADRVQRSMDFLSTFPIKENGLFPVGYDVKKATHYGGDHVSCGQAMYNFAKAIKTARKHKHYKIKAWENFLQKTCDGQSKRILSDSWSPVSTAESFYIAPLVLASKLFKNPIYMQAARKASEVAHRRHSSMQEPYWGGTLDATCEDKEGAWAAFQGFITMYEQTKEKHFLDKAKHAMDVCLSYAVVWDIPLPAGRLADHNFKTTGWTVVSPQNQHIDVYGVFFTPEVYKMGIYLRDDRLCKLARVMYRSCYQLADARGCQGEQLQQTNFAQHGDMNNVHRLRGGYSEGWTVFWITAHFLNAAARFEEMGVQP